MLTKYALVAIIVLCCTVLGFTLMVGDSLQGGKTCVYHCNSIFMSSIEK